MTFLLFLQTGLPDIICSSLLTLYHVSTSSLFLVIESLHKTYALLIASLLNWNIRPRNLACLIQGFQGT